MILGLQQNMKGSSDSRSEEGALLLETVVMAPVLMILLLSIVSGFSFFVKFYADMRSDQSTRQELRSIAERMVQDTESASTWQVTSGGHELILTTTRGGLLRYKCNESSGIMKRVRSAADPGQPMNGADVRDTLLVTEFRASGSGRLVNIHLTGMNKRTGRSIDVDTAVETGGEPHGE